MMVRMVLLLGMALASGPLASPVALAQMSPPPGNLALPPPRGSQPAAPAAPASKPVAAPRAPVQQVAPMTAPVPPQAPSRSTLGTSAPGKPPVVAPRPNSGPQKQPVPAGRAGGTTAAAAAGVAASVAAAAAPQRPGEVKPADKPAADAKLAAPRATEPTKGTDTGQPLPRWAGILYDGVKLRVGPGQRYPVEWIYRRPDQPVRVLREFDNWRLIEDHEGVKGWVHQSNLTGRRSFMVPTERMLRRSASEDATAVAVLRPGVVGRVRGCPAGGAWCEVRVGDRRGWIQREGLWGIPADEAIGN